MATSENSSFTSLTGQFLISEADLEDPNFRCSVILMISHDPTGAFGLVVNRPSSSVFRDIFPQFEDHPAGDIPLFVGGPVQREYLFLIEHGLDLHPEGTMQITKDIYFVPNVGPVLEYIHESWADLPPDGRPLLRFCAGYSGWGPGQVETELAMESWVTHTASTEIIFRTKPEKGWRRVLQQKGGIYWIMGETGAKPSMN